VDRYAYLLPDEKPGTEKEEQERKKALESSVTKIEAFAQSILDRLPVQMRGMPMGMDLTILADGSMRMIETNAGGNSGFLSDATLSIFALDRFLKRYAKDQMNSSEQEIVDRGLSPEEQMSFIRDFFQRNGVSVEEQFPHMKFRESQIGTEEIRIGKTLKAVSVEAGLQTPLRCEEIFR
jgi:hypothetical protein